MPTDKNKEDVIQALWRIYNNRSIAYSLGTDVTGLLREGSFDCEWDELLFRLFTYFFCTRSCLSGTQEEDERLELDTLPELSEIKRLRETESWTMLSDEKDENLTQICPKWMVEFPPFDLLKVNLTWKLLLDLRCMYSNLHTWDLISLHEQYGSTQKDSSQLSRFPIKNYPRFFRRRFYIKCENGRYIIKTHFPELLIALIEHQNDLPFRDKSTSSKWNKNISLYQDCLSAIAPNNVWTKDSYMAYYLFEHLFRLNTKIRLFFEFERVKKGIKIEEEKIRSNIQDIADFFFASPLIFIPDDYLLPVISSSKSCCMDALQMMSLYYFPAMLCTAKYFISNKGIYDYDRFLDYVFPCEEKWNEWTRQYSSFMPSTLDDKNLKRGVKLDDYQDVWRNFYPTNGFSKSTYRMQYF